MDRTEFSFRSNDQKTEIHCLKWQPKGQPRGVLQIAHGMAEFIERYADFAAYLAGRGFVVYGNDHLGHGASVARQEDWGFFADKDGGRLVLEDMHSLTQLARRENGDLPIFLLGHSMGSFFTRLYLGVYGTDIAGAIICGTGQQSRAFLVGGRAICSIIAARKGWRQRSRFVNKLALGGMNKAFEPARTKLDWLSRDQAVVDAYLAEPRNTFTFTLRAYYDLFGVMLRIQSPKILARMDREKPLLFIAGGADSVGANGRGVRKVVDGFKKSGMRKVELLIYPEYRHEVLNELGKEKVYADVAGWLEDLSRDRAFLRQTGQAECMP